MANTARKRMKPGYSRPLQNDNSRRWQDIGTVPDSPLWKSYTEWQYIKNKREAAQAHDENDNGDWDAIEIHHRLPHNFPYANENQMFAMILTENARDELVANGHIHVATATHKGFEYYFFAHTWDFNADIANYFDEGIDYPDRSVL